MAICRPSAIIHNSARGKATIADQTSEELAKTPGIANRSTRGAHLLGSQIRLHVACAPLDSAYSGNVSDFETRTDETKVANGGAIEIKDVPHQKPLVFQASVRQQETISTAIPQETTRAIVASHLGRVNSRSKLLQRVMPRVSSRS